MITRPLDLASKLRPEPKNFGAAFFLNVGLIVLFFSLFGSRFVLAPGLGVDFRLPAVTGADVGARLSTHVIDVTNSGQIFTSHGIRKLEELGGWLKGEARSTTSPVLLARVGAGVPMSLWTEIASIAHAAGFKTLLAAEEPKTEDSRGGR